ncbi:cytochrome-c peroxidase, partial [Mesorhizobium sp. M00.F.Ca.ET.149.01.1.1]
MTMGRWKSQTLVLAATSLVGFTAPANTTEPSGLHPGPMTRQEAYARAEALTVLGRKMFLDP